MYATLIDDILLKIRKSPEQHLGELKSQESSFARVGMEQALKAISRPP